MIKYIVLFLLYPLIVFGANTSYYIDATSGDDSNTGLSHAQAWATIAKVEGFSFASGDNVYFLCGETWSGESLTVDWAGTEGDPVVIGAYYMDGSETIGVNGDGEPIIQGTLVDENEKTPGTNYGLIDVRGGQDWITVQDMEVKDSGGYGIAFLTNSDNCVAQRNTVDHTYQNSILFWNNSNGMAEYNTVSRAAKARVLDQPDYWPGGVQGALTVRYNTIYNMWGEGINTINNGIVMYNLVYDTMSPGIYVNGKSGIEIAYNLVFGTDDSTYELVSGWHNSGIKIAIEITQNNHAENNYIHNNIVINTYAGIHLQSQNTDYEIRNNYIYNNTFIDNRFNVYANNNNSGINYTNYLKNNLSYDNHADSGNVDIVSINLTAWVADYNHWGPTYNEVLDGLEGANDTTGSTDIDVLTWRGTTALNNNTFTIANLSIDAGAQLIDAGISLVGETYDLGFTQVSSKPPNAISTFDRDTYGWDMGAVVYDAADTPPTMEGASIGTNGTTLTLTFSAAITQGAGYNDADFDLDISGGTQGVGITYSSGDTTDTHIYIIAQTINYGEVVDIDFNGDADSMENGAGTDLAAIVSGAVSNNSQQNAPSDPVSTVSGGNVSVTSGGNVTIE